MGLLQIDKIDNFIESRQNNAKKYFSELESLGDFFSFQITTKDSENSHFGFPMILKNNTYFNRNEICTFLNNNGIETRPIISGNFANQPAAKLYKLCKKNEKFENAQKVQELGFLIGLHTKKLSKKNLDLIHDSFFMIDNI